jgi:hypothetical protein
MNREQTDAILKGWCEFLLGAPNTRYGPDGYSAPPKGGTLPTSFYDEYEFVQGEICRHCPKAWDRSMLTAILQERYYRGRDLESPIVPHETQRRAIDEFRARFLTLTFVKKSDKIEVG